jgi:hypothetical protein
MAKEPRPMAARLVHRRQLDRPPAETAADATNGAGFEPAPFVV